MALSGSICALATPFRARDGALDLDAYGRLIDQQLADGTRALVVAGSTGEAAALDDDEYPALIAFAVARVAGRVPVLAGSGLPSTRRTIVQTQRAVDAGADYALVVAPAYVRPTQEGMLRHFSEVADHARVPVVLYNVPGRTACDLHPDTVARLAGHGNIAGIKEAVGEEARMRDLLALRTPSFSILSGDDPTCARAQLAGADGVISVAANVAPALFAAMCEACARRDEAQANELDRRLRPLYDALALEPNPIPLKWCLSRLGLGSATPRLPLTELSPPLRAAADRVLAELGLVEAAPAVG
ncbi:4-hydroxy-tetrahydrodipicolinate synthase [Dokdonella fugitiva]|uniref:4-hydroxy-tetrahydrodipicolinate synthase n=1 Tax=Dokdonella fugitiva TaxID=328517 RepID=A0A4R2IBL7_9GAMM|nr:4-hydroxy-tetrahydrodipicolinate synthase [Dokdonella fugitiva]TCO41903.1 4-hydroxy-tetrahydrodipicolinate synthase [Dokdonella fugitiva]